MSLNDLTVYLSNMIICTEPLTLRRIIRWRQVHIGEVIVQNTSVVLTGLLVFYFQTDVKIRSKFMSVLLDKKVTDITWPKKTAVINHFISAIHNSKNSNFLFNGLCLCRRASLSSTVRCTWGFLLGGLCGRHDNRASICMSQIFWKGHLQKHLWCCRHLLTAWLSC